MAAVAEGYDASMLKYDTFKKSTERPKKQQVSSFASLYTLETSFKSS